MMTDKHLVYVAGYGRSGSTLLSITLDNLPRITSVGELAALPKYLDTDGLHCSCNRRYTKCPFWSQVIDLLPGTTKYLQELQAVRSILEPLGSLPFLFKSPTLIGKYIRYNKELLESIFTVASNNILVDSSKTSYKSVWRPFLLGLMPGVKVHVIHLIRNPKNVLSSCKKGRNKSILLDSAKRPTPLRTLLALCGWLISNAIAKYYGLSSVDLNYILVPYKKLVDDPKFELQRVLSTFPVPIGAKEIDSNRQINENTFDVGHLVGSNRFAKNREKIQVNNDDSSPKNLNKIESMVSYIAKLALYSP
jgi:hypothetical protein